MSFRPPVASDVDYLKFSRPLGPRRGYLRDLPVSHLPLLRGRHELEHSPRSALLRAEGAYRRTEGWDNRGQAKDAVGR